MQYNFLGQILLESPSKMIQDIDSWNAKLDPKTDALLYKEMLSR